MGILDFIKDNPWLILIFVSWLVSAFGGLMQKAAKKAAEQQQKAARQQGAPPSPAGQARADQVRASQAKAVQARARGAQARMTQAVRRPERAAPPAATSNEGSQPRMSAQMMREVGGGSRLEDERRLAGSAFGRQAATRGPSRMDAVEPELIRASGVTPPPMPVEIVTGRRTSLSEEMAQKDAAHRREHLGRLEERDAQLGQSISSRHLQVRGVANVRSVTGGRPGKRSAAQQASALLRLDRPAHAIVSLEVLGTPVGLRDRPLGRPYF